MKTLKSVCIITFIAAIFLSFGIVSALEQNEASAHTVFSTSSPKQGQTITVTITFQSAVNEQLKIYYIGIHGDWMPSSTDFYGQNLSDEPATVSGNGHYVADTFTITIPASASVGTHKYYVGVDGLDSSGKIFSWSSEEATITILANSATTSPTGTTNPDGGDGQADTTDWLPYLVVAAAAAVVAILIVVTLIQKKRKPAALVSEPFGEQPSSPKSEQPKPEQKPGNDQEFTI